MTHNELCDGLKQLGFNSGWAASGEEIVLWEHTEPQPTAAAIAKAAPLWAATVAAQEAAQAAAKKSAQNKLAALGLTADEIAAL